MTLSQKSKWKGKIVVLRNRAEVDLWPPYTFRNTRQVMAEKD